MTARSAPSPRGRLVRWLAAWVDGVRRAAWPVTAAALLVTAGLGVYTARTIGINTNTLDMLSPELPWRQVHTDYRTTFPYFSNLLVVVVEGETGDRTSDAAARLHERLAAQPDRFGDVFYPAGHPYFRRNGLLYMDVEALYDLSDRLGAAQPLLAELSRDPSLRGLFGLYGQLADAARGGNVDSSPQMNAALSRSAAVIDSVAEGRPERLSWTALMQGQEALDGRRRSIIVLQPPLDWSSLAPARATMQAVRALARDMGLTAENGVRVRLTGSAAINTEELSSVAGSAATAGVLSLLMVTILLVIGLRSARLVLAVVATLIIGLVWTAAFAAAAVGTLNLISVAFAVLFIGLGVDFGIHFALRYREALAAAGDHGQALRDAATGVGGSLSLSALAAALAFFSFLPTAYRGVSELGLIAGVGMFVALFANMTVLPALLSIGPPTKRIPRLPAAGSLGHRVDAFLRRRARVVVAIAVVVGVGALALTPLARFDYNPLNLKDPTTESVATALELSASDGQALDAITVVADTPAAAADMAAALRALPEVARVVTLADFVPRGQDEKLEVIDDMALFLTPVIEPGETAAAPTNTERAQAVENLRQKLDALPAAVDAPAEMEAFQRLADALEHFSQRFDADPAALGRLETALLDGFGDSRRALIEALSAEPVTRQDLPKDLLERQIAADGRVRLEVFAAADLTDNAALRRFVEAVRTVAPNATDNPVIALEAGDAVVQAFKAATIYAVVAILVLLIVVLRRLSEIALVVLPLLLAAALTFGTTVVAGLSFNFANLIALPLLAGLGVASGIHLVLRARGEAYATVMATSTSRAVVFSALTTMASFGSLGLSSHWGMASMGILLTIALTATLLSALVVLPALMAVTMRGGGRPAS